MRKNQDEEETGPSKKVKLDEAECEDNDEVEDAEDDTTNDNMNDTKIDQSIYAVEEKKLLKFPTILDLLSIDNDVVKNLLIEKCNIDKMLVVPQFERFLEYLPDLSKANKTIVGCDGDGKVLSIDPSSFHDISCDMVMGYIDPSPIAFNNPEKMLLEWGGKDVRSRWPEFAKHLEGEPKQMRSKHQRQGDSIRWLLRRARPRHPLLRAVLPILWLPLQPEEYLFKRSKF